MSVYGSDPFAYDFEAALASARTIELPEEPQELRDDRAYWLRHFPEPPSTEAVRRHLRGYGDEGLEGIASAYRLDVSEHGQELDELVSAVKSRTSRRRPQRRVVRRRKAARFS